MKRPRGRPREYDPEEALDAAIKAGTGRQELSELTYETQLVRSYFGSAGGGAEQSP